MANEENTEVEGGRRGDGEISVDTAAFDFESWIDGSRHEGWVRDVVRDVVTDLFGAFRAVSVFGSVDLQKFAEDILSDVDRVIAEEGAQFLNSPEWEKNGVDNSQRWALAGIVAGALRSECGSRDLPVRSDEISRVLERQTGAKLETKNVTRFKRRVDSAAGAWVSPPAVDQFLERYAEELSIHPDTLAEALSIVDELPENTDTNVAAATALWLASRQTDEPMRRTTLLRTTNVSGPAVRQATPDQYDYDKPTIRFGRKVSDSITLPAMIVEWLSLHDKHVIWPALEEMQDPVKDSVSVRTIPRAVAQLTVVDHTTDHDRPVSTIKEHEQKDGIWEFDVPLEYHEYLPETVVLSWQWDWDQNTGQLVLREQDD